MKNPCLVSWFRRCVWLRCCVRCFFRAVTHCGGRVRPVASPHGETGERPVRARRSLPSSRSASSSALRPRPVVVSYAGEEPLGWSTLTGPALFRETVNSPRLLCPVPRSSVLSSIVIRPPDLVHRALPCRFDPSSFSFSSRLYHHQASSSSSSSSSRGFFLPVCTVNLVLPATEIMTR